MYHSHVFQKAISELPFAAVSKGVDVRNHSNENEFDLHENGRVCVTHFHMYGFARGLVLKQRQGVTRKWPILMRACILNRGQVIKMFIQKIVLKMEQLPTDPQNVLS